MKPLFKKTLFLFRRDFRLEDNTGLIFALHHSKLVIPAFIFTPEQIEKNPYRSDHCLKFMIESLEDLDNQLKAKGSRLYVFKGETDKIVLQCISQLNIDALVVNCDYTSYSRERDARLELICKKHSLPFHSFHDALLLPPEDSVKKDGNPYTVFTPYFQNALKHTITPPQHNRWSNYFHNPIPFAEKTSPIPLPNVTTTFKGGRHEALKILSHLKSLHDSTHLSPYLKFNLCSPREVYVLANPTLIRSLYWRDFFTTVAFFFPHVFKGAFYPKFDHLKWCTDESKFKKWCQGKTGFPIVDAAMRELNATGFIPNRMRMIAASFLIKDLFIHWQWGEKYFAQTLIDYDPAVNNGNWQWVAGTGCGAQPYFRIFNPWAQQKKFDPECLYIKKWVPELTHLSPKIIHSCLAHQENPNYPPPMIDHHKAAQKTLASYKKIL